MLSSQKADHPGIHHACSCATALLLHWSSSFFTVYMAGAALAVARRSSCYATALGVARVSKDGPPRWTAKQGQPTGLEER